jgi:hypothetical protein
MAIIPNDEKVFMVSKGTNTTYSGSTALKAMQEWYTMQDIADSLPAGSSSFNMPLPKSFDSGTGYSASLSAGNLVTIQQVPNLLIFSPFIPAHDIEITNLSIVVSASVLVPDSLSKILVYGNSATGTTPSGLLIESTDLDCSTAGRKIYNVNYTFKAGTIYWIGTISNSTQRLSCISALYLMAIGCNSSTGQVYTGRSTTYYPYTSPLPDSIGSFPLGNVSVTSVILN